MSTPKLQETPQIGRCPDCGLEVFPSTFGHVAGCPRLYKAIRLSRAVECRGRLFIRVTMPDGRRQGFYKSTGRNSGQPGVWFPCDGWQTFPRLWVDKERFCHDPRMPDNVPLSLERFGTEEWKRVSKEIKRQEKRPKLWREKHWRAITREPRKASPQGVNKHLATPHSERNHWRNATMAKYFKSLRS